MGQIDEDKALFWLSLSGATARKINSVLSGRSAIDLWYESGESLNNLQAVFGKNYENLLKYRNIDLIENGMEKIKSKGIGILTIKNRDYPLYLSQPEVSPPIVLYYMGNLRALEKPCVAIVGTRSNSSYGAAVAELLGREFALAGATVVSGMASGIDECAHKSALAAGLTAAVLGGGFNYVSAYSKALFEKIIASNGIVVSEYRPNVSPTKYSFPERNRIISGLSQAVVVIEAGERSGALITADFALEQNRDVYAVPGSILSAKSCGCNNLIKNGEAQIITSANDILINLKLNSTSADKKQLQISLDFFEEKIYNLLSDGQLHFNDLIEKSDSEPKEVMKVLTNLELKGVTKRLPGNFYRISI